MRRGYHEAFHGRVVLITGASRGIGAEVARAAARSGATVLLTSRTRDDLEGLEAEIRAKGGHAEVFVADLRDPDEVDRLATAVIEAHGGVDVLIHNAGHSIRRNLAASADRAHDFERTMRLNYQAPVRLTLALLPSLRQRRGSVSLVLTLGVVIPGPYFPAYHASKSALGAFGDAMAAELRHEGVHVSSVYLPLVRTRMMAPTKEYAGRSDLMSVERAAREVLDGVVYRRRRVISLLGRAYLLANYFLPALTTRVLNALAGAFPIDGGSIRHPRTRRLLQKLVGGAPI